jgi:low temperature requirement protein LtrA
MDGHVILASFCLGCAALALWLLVRFPALGPRRPATVILAVLAIGVGLSLAGALFDAVTRLGSYGVALALVAVVVPVLTGAFWVTGCALRVLAGMPGPRS